MRRLKDCVNEQLSINEAKPYTNDFGLIVVKVKKKFMYKDIPMQLIVTEEELTKDQTWNPIKAVGPNGVPLPIHFESKQTIKSMVDQVISMLTSAEKMGLDVKHNLTTNDY